MSITPLRDLKKISRQNDEENVSMIKNESNTKNGAINTNA